MKKLEKFFPFSSKSTIRRWKILNQVILARHKPEFNEIRTQTARFGLKGRTTK